MGKHLVTGLFAATLLWTGAAKADCNRAMADVVTQVALAGHPFSAIPAPDGCTIYVSLTARQSQIAILKRDKGTVTPAQTVPADGLVAGLALSPDGRFLAAANGAGALLFDTARLAAGDAEPLAKLDDGADPGGVYSAFSPDGRLLAIANERSASLSLYDTSALPAAPRLIGKLTTGRSPVGLALSADGRLLYSTSQVSPLSWPNKCRNPDPLHPEGMLLVFDVAKATADPKAGMVAGVAAGCSAVRLALSPDGKTAYVTGRGDNAVRVFDTAALLKDPTHALTATVPVGAAPVGVTAGGGQVFVTNSNRFVGGDSQSVSVLDAAHLEVAPRAIPAGGFPRELMITADGNTLLVTNYTSSSLELVDLKRLAEAAK